MKQSLAAGFIYLSVSSILYIIAGYVVNVVPGLFLETSSYGIFGIVNSIMTTIALTQTSGIPQAVTKYCAEYPENAGSVLQAGLKIQLASNFLVMFLYICASPLISWTLSDNQYTFPLILSAFILPTYGLYTLYISYYNGIHNFLKQSILISIYSILKIVAVSALVLYFGLNGAIIGYTIAPLFVVLFIFKLPKATINFDYKLLIKFAFPIILLTLAITLLQSADIYLLKLITGSNDLSGSYTAAQNIARIPIFGLSALSALLFPSVAAAGKLNKLKIKKLAENGLRVTFTLLIPLTFFMIAYARNLLNIIYQARYNTAESSLQILLVGMAFLTIFIVITSITSAVGAIKDTVIIALSGIVLIIISSLILIQNYSVKGAAIATTLGCILVALLGLRHIKVNFSIRLPVRTIIISILSASIITNILLFIKVEGMVSFSIIGIVYILAYLLSLFIFQEITVIDLKRMPIFKR